MPPLHQVRRPEVSPLVHFLFGSIDNTVTTTTNDNSNTTTNTVSGINSTCFSRGRIGTPLGPRALALLHTRYHAVPKLELVTPLAAKW